MFRKSKQPYNDEPRRFFQECPPVNSESGAEGAIFSVGTEASSMPAVNSPSKPGLFSRLFKRKVSISSNNNHSKNGIPESLNDPAPPPQSQSPAGFKRKSLWQRSKSILRPRASMNRSESTVLDLPNLNVMINGSGSAAELLLDGFPPVDQFYTERIGVDTDGLLARIFENNHVIYEQLLEEERKKKNFNCDGVLSPVTTVNSLLEVAGCGFSQDGYRNDMGIEEQHHHHFEDNLKLDSPLLSESGDNGGNVCDNCDIYDNCEDTFDTVDTIDDNCINHSNESESESEIEDCSQSLSTSIHSYLELSGNDSFADIAPLSLDRMAEMFEVLTVREPETLADGTLRYICENEVTGSDESIQFQKCWVLPEGNDDGDGLVGSFKEEDYRKCKSEDQVKKVSTLKMRSHSMAQFPDKKTIISSSSSFDRRRSLGAKVSRIVALFENPPI
jgi:hypothetical protein